MQWGRRELPPRLLRLGEEHGWTVRNYPLLSLGEVTASGDEVWGDVRECCITRVASKRLTRVLAERRVNTDRVGRVLMLAGVRPPTALGPGSYHHEILVGLGATPAIAQGAPYVTLDAEDLLRLAPDVIILVQPRWGGGQWARRMPPRCDGDWANWVVSTCRRFAMAGWRCWMTRWRLCRGRIW